MTKSIVAFLLIFIGTKISHAQSLSAYEKAANTAFQKKDYGAAMEYFQLILETEPNNNAVRWRYAETAQLFFAFEEAEKQLLKIEKSKKSDQFPLLYLRMGDVKKAQGDYEEAIIFYEKFIAEQPKQPETAAASAAAAACKTALQLSEQPAAFEVKRLGKEVNSPYSDFGAFQRGDTLYFSSYRFEDKISKTKPAGKLTQNMISIGGKRAREVGAGFPKPDSVHTAHGAMTADGRFLFFNFCKKIEKTGDIRCQIYLTVKNKRGRWSAPQRLPAPVNEPNSTQTQPSVAYFSDRKTPFLMFASDRPGGGGGLDLYAVALDSAWFCPCHADKFGTKKDPKLPAFMTPENLKSINTAGNEATPFFHTGSQTLYFSTDSREGLGGYDIFASPYQDGQWGQPKNAGVGLNSSYNDLYPFFSEDGNSGYFSSNRVGVFYLDEKNKACCNDIFSFKKLPPPETTIPLTPDSLYKITEVPSPKVQVPSGTPPNTSTPLPTITPAKIQDFVGLPLYFDNDEPDKRTRRTTTKKSYESTVLAYLERQEEYRERFSAGLPEAQKELAENAIDQHFDQEIRRGYDRLAQLTELIFNRLQTGESIEVVLKGFTSPRAQSDYNLNLGKRRISSVRNHFEIWSEGVLKPYITTGKLKITETSFGETTARSGISDNLKDERNSIFSPDAARERRVEILEIRE